MINKNVLIFYITENSGHHIAAKAIDYGIRKVNKSADVMCVDAFRFANPILERVVTKTYIQVIKTNPEIWDYLYDNVKFKKRTEYFRKLIHKFNSIKLKKLIVDRKPDIIICTQAFPCGTVSDYKRTEGVDIPLVAVVTDFAAHSYWLYDNVDLYVVPTNEVKEKLAGNGVSRNKIKVLGIPINPVFNEKFNPHAVRARFSLSKNLPIVLIMGGGQGLGPIKDIVKELDVVSADFQIVVATGINKMLKNRLEKLKRKISKPLTILGYVENINELMSISEVLVTKPGGLTTSEAIAMKLPMVIVNPIPGQEAKNTEFLISKNAAIAAEDSFHVAVTINDLIRNPSKLRFMKENASEFSKPDSAVNIAKEILEFGNGDTFKV